MAKWVSFDIFMTLWMGEPNISKLNHIYTTLAGWRVHVPFLYWPRHGSWYQGSAWNSLHGSCLCFVGTKSVKMLILSLLNSGAECILHVPPGDTWLSSIAEVPVASIQRTGSSPATHELPELLLGCSLQSLQLQGIEQLGSNYATLNSGGFEVVLLQPKRHG